MKEMMMNCRKQLGMTVLAVLVFLLILALTGNREGTLTVTMLGTLLVVPIMASRYAVRDLQRESAVAWFFLSWIPYVPILLLLEKPEKPESFSPDMKVGGRSAEEYGMGELTHFFSARSHRYLGWKIASVLLALMIAPLAVVPVIGTGRADGPVAVILPFFVIITLSALFVWRIDKQEKKNGRLWVVLFTEGIVCTWPDTGNKQFRWSEVQKIWQDFRDQYVNGLRTVHRRRCRLEIPGWTSGIEFSEKLQGIEELTGLIHENATPFILKRMEADLDAGKALNFGNISVSEKGIGLKRDLLPWTELAGVFLDSGYVVIARNARSSSEARIKKASQGLSAFATRIVGTAQPFSPGGDTVIWKKTPIDRTPNPVTLTVLVAEILQRSSSAASVATF